MQTEPQILPSREHEPHLLRRSEQEQFELAERFIGGELVQVVDHEREPLLERDEISEQTLDGRPAIERRRGAQRAHDPRPGVGGT